jgi:hypothetical protein
MRSDMSWRLKVFGQFPDISKHDDIEASLNEWYSIEAEIYNDHATYSINGSPYADCNYDVGLVADKGYFGFAVYSGDEVKEIRNVII